MRNHKYNVERRMKLEQQLEDSNINMNSKAYSGLCLDPSWYTDNIYSNQSIDLEEEYNLRYHNYRDNNSNNKCISSHKYDQVCELKNETVGKTKNNLYKYPKASSCCFGMTEYVPKPKISIPKSHSFSAENSRPSLMKLSKIHSKPPIPSNSFDPFTIPHRACNNIECFNEPDITHDLIDIDINKSDDEIDSRIDDWTERIYDNNGNLSEYFTADEEICDDDTTQSFSSPETLSYDNSKKNHKHDKTIKDNELYFMESTNQNFNDNSSPIYKFNSFRSYDCDEPFLDESLELDEITKNEHSKLLMQNKTNKYRDNLAFHSYLRSNDFHSLYNLNRIRNKSLLEVKLPKKYDDSSSDSTDQDLDDFNFDLNKYWDNNYMYSDLGRTYYSNKNLINCHNYHNNFTKIKNTNIGRYNNGINNDCCSHLLRNDFYKCLNNNPNSFYRNTYPNKKLNRRKGYINHYNNCITCSHQSQLPPSSPVYATDSLHSSTNRLNFINNIFSIYKPNKYSPLNCEVQKLPQKFDDEKKNNIHNSRLLPFRKSEFLSSLKRPLLINPHYSSTHPKFKIIPEKRGLKISPLYKIEPDYNIDNENFDKSPYLESQLKSTSRPLLFRH